MKLPGRNKGKKPDDKSKPGPRKPRAPTTPMMEDLRRDPPARVIDLTGDAFQGSFPSIAERMSQQRRAHRRRTAQQQAVTPPDDSGDDGGDNGGEDNDT